MIYKTLHRKLKIEPHELHILLVSGHNICQVYGISRLNLKFEPKR